MNLHGAKRRSREKRLLFFLISIPNQPCDAGFCVFLLTNVKNTLYIVFMGFYSWIQGGFRGKVGAHIGQKIDGKYIQKAYAVPRNPQSPAQQAQRNKFNAPNEYNKQVLLWNLYPDETGAERADANAKQISDFFKYNDSLKKSLFRMRFPTYEKRTLESYLFSFDVMNGEIDVEPYYESAVDEDDEDLEFECVIRVCVYDYTQKLFLFGESPTLAPDSRGHFGDYGFFHSFEFFNDAIIDTDVVVGFCYPIIDGKKYARDFFNQEDW